MPKLVVLSEGLTGKSYELKVDRTTVGRVEDNSFQIPEASVSSHHCEVLLKGTEVRVKDLNSTNGTFINGDRITEGVLKPGQILRLGTIDLRLESDKGAASGKKVLDHTMVIKGVKLESESGTRPVSFETDSPFHKKRKGENKVFIASMVIAGLLIVVCIVLAVIKLRSE